MKKIGILTYFWGHNPGTFLQAYSTLNATKRYFPSYQIELINCKLRRVRFRPSRYDFNIYRLQERYRNHTIYEKLIKLYLPKSPNSVVTFNYETLTKYILSQNYDLIIVGADTVLEILPKHFSLGQVPIYWLPPKVKCKKIMFSASAGALTYDPLDKVYQKALSDSINSFDLVGVRDDNTYNLIKRLGMKKDVPVQITPDPTFSIEIDYAHVERFLYRKQIKFEKPTIAINLPESLSLCQKLVAYYQNKGISVVLLGYGGYASKRRECRFPMMSPLEWAGVHRYFSLEITDRFHGCIFALRNFTPVVAIDYEQRKHTASGLSKTYSLLKLYDMHNTNHVNTTKIGGFEEIMQVTDRALEFFDREYVERRTEELRKDYISFMKKVGQLLA